MNEVKLSDPKWLQRGMNLALEAKEWSKDPKVGVGACVAPPSFRQFSLGFNGFPAGIADTTERLNDKALKNELMRHAEANALSNAAFNVRGCYLFVTRSPCVRCVIDHIIPNGIAAVIIHSPSKGYDRQSSRFKDLQKALSYLQEANVKVIYI